MPLLGEPSLFNTILFHITTYAPLAQKQMGGRDKFIIYGGVVGGASSGRVVAFGFRMSSGYIPGRKVGLAGFPLLVP
jgi:hypothetical protein